ncbi:MAG: hypothetical protein CV087_12455 [Candidatus Brocadia sp. WS118]|nr:MAG: hypothetical protein CV087_12455 [Candidatus Brocadia sp. WS118]
MRGKLVTIGGCLFVFIMTIIIVVGSADAKTENKKGGKLLGNNPEPASCVLFALGVSTLFSLRYLRNRMVSKELNDQHNNSNNLNS